MGEAATEALGLIQDLRTPLPPPGPWRKRLAVELLELTSRSCRLGLAVFIVAFSREEL